ncbi:MAG: UDP-N-acetylmuramate dehydrogenase [Helicobacteraceae bacterium]|nr:UDP-N-acetylmuramate dehydrogenase [Helicobacteraceae bacterium]
MQYKTINFSKYSSIKIGPSLDVALLEECSDYDPSFTLLGAANNTLIGNKPPPLMILSKKYDFIKIKDSTLIIGGATPSGKIASFCKKHNIAHFEFLSHLPGTLGGLLKMNAGLKEYEIFEHLLEIYTCAGVYQKEKIEHGYRFTNISSPILEARFSLEYGFDPTKVEMFHAMRSNQPNIPSAGSCFKNPSGDYAGRLIEAVGLKGKRKGAMEFSSVHANFLVNHGGGSFEDAIYLIEEAKKKVLENFQILLECEIEILENT